jgi:hypothetical protein
MWLPLEHELHFRTSQRATDGKDISSFEKKKRDGNCMLNNRERERERERQQETERVSEVMIELEE